MSQPACDVICVGILVSDLFVPPLPRLPAAGELLQVPDFLLTVGGCAANTGIGLARLGYSVTVAGKVGQDLFGDFVVQTLQQQGLGTTGIRRSAATSTARTVILPVSGEDRRYIHAIGANADFGPDDIDLEQVRRARVLYVGGYLLLPGLWPQALAELFAYARHNGVKTVLDVAGVRPGAGLDLLQPVLPYTDVFLPNLDEARMLTDHQDPVRQAETLLARGVRTVAITMGADGAIVCTCRDRLRVGAFQVKVVDPSGGGDAYDAGFIAGLLEGWDLAQTATFAAALGASACTQLGCTGGVFSRAEAEAFVARTPIDLVRI